MIGGKLGGLNGLCYAYLAVGIVEGIVTAPTVLRAAYGRSRKAATGGLAALTVAADAARPVPAETGYLHRQQAGLAALVAIAAAAVAEGHTLDAATEVWRTGSFPAITPDNGRPPRVAAVTDVDLFKGRPVKSSREDAGYGRRQQAGLDALIAMATPVIPRE